MVVKAMSGVLGWEPEGSTKVINKDKIDVYCVAVHDS